MATTHPELLSITPYRGGGICARTSHWIVAAHALPDGCFAVGYAPAPRLDGGAGDWPLVRGPVRQWRLWTPPLWPGGWEGTSIVPAASDPSSTLAVPSDGEAAPPPPARSSPWMIALFALVLFVLVPQLSTAWLLSLANLDAPIGSVMFHVGTSLFSIGLFATYLAVVGRVDELRVAFQQSAASNGVYAALRGGESFSLRDLRDRSPLHPASAATFFTLVALVMPFFSLFLARPLVALPHAAAHAILFLLKVVTLPIVWGVAFEAQRLMERAHDLGLLRPVWNAIGVLQQFSMREPTDADLALAIVTANVALRLEAETSRQSESPRPAA